MSRELIRFRSARASRRGLDLAPANRRLGCHPGQGVPVLVSLGLARGIKQCTEKNRSKAVRRAKQSHPMAGRRIFLIGPRMTTKGEASVGSPVSVR